MFVDFEFDHFKNRVYNFFKGSNLKRLKKIDRLKLRFDELTELSDNTFLDDDGFPTNDLRKIFLDKYFIRQEIEKLEKVNDNVNNGYYRRHWYPDSRYRYFEDLYEAIHDVVNSARDHRDRNYMLCWDEGFIDLNHKAGVPEEITAFFNEASKLSIDLIVCSQRPVAIYPSFRALCEFMVRVEKEKILGIETSNFKAFKYYVDSDANALPDLSKDAEDHDKGEPYDSWSGKDIFPYFQTRESIAVKKLFKKFIK